MSNIRDKVSMGCLLGCLFLGGLATMTKTLNPQRKSTEKSVIPTEIVNKNLQDSLKMDSIAKKAYFEGAQMVRDSIKKCSKIK